MLKKYVLARSGRFFNFGFVARNTTFCLPVIQAHAQWAYVSIIDCNKIDDRYSAQLTDCAKGELPQGEMEVNVDD